MSFRSRQDQPPSNSADRYSLSKSLANATLQYVSVDAC